MPLREQAYRGSIRGMIPSVWKSIEVDMSIVLKHATAWLDQQTLDSFGLSHVRPRNGRIRPHLSVSLTEEKASTGTLSS